MCATKKALKHQCSVSVGSRDFTSLDGVCVKLHNFGCKDSVGWGAFSWKLRWPKFLADAKNLGGRQNFAKILGRQNFVRDSMAGQNYSPRFHTGSPHMETRKPTKKCHLGTPHYQTEFVTIWGLTSTLTRSSEIKWFHIWNRNT